MTISDYEKTAPSTYTMSIEPVDGPSFINGFHLGTIESVARDLCVERFHGRNAADMPTRTIALIRNRRIVDVYDGAWFNGYKPRTKAAFAPSSFD